MPNPITEDELDKNIIIQAIQDNPSAVSAWKAVMRRIDEKNARRSKILTLVQEALQELRLQIKYLTFDLEATRRERDALREKYEGN